MELAVLGAASYRATQLGVHDTILDPARQRLHAWHANNLDSRPRAFIVQLISCIYCLGWWLSGVTLLVYLLATDSWGDTSWIVHGIEWFAIAGIQALLNRRDDTFGG
ncbi:DUF1360 domain-containing protein [Streptomyces pimonensis]